MADRNGIPGHTIELYVQFRDAFGNPVDTDDTPKARVSDSTGRVWQVLSKSGVTGVSDATGLYRLTYNIPLGFADGYAEDYWQAKIGNETVTASFSFLIRDDGSAEESEEPVYTPGDDFTFEYSKAETEGINRLMKILKKRLKSDGTRKVPDGSGGYIEGECNVFSNDELICFLINSLSSFNQIPHFTDFSFAHQLIYDTFADVIIQGAVILALAAQTLIEKGREFVITDQGVSYQPPAVSDILNTQYNTQLTNYTEKLKYIKANLKPSPKGLGTFRVTSVSPAFMRLRHLRQRQVI